MQQLPEGAELLPKSTIFCGMLYLCAVTPVFAIHAFGPIILSAFGLNDGNRSHIGYALISLGAC